ncbi:ATP-, maltotriose-and DNA-dependent transcriptional regulator MalT [Mycolicibacterium rutilum]|uniref:ATP-, maltotriose-and DNA-dependent transcriptional regulator MalT n=2 Tax=Mycolicibacterium rutilum TaxID=370526 RepID=A0A1H6IZN2_MYCRU|nr:ATP-, maltotriose-and DNA-dependent transcriptional regulator MalT [Mycolicibacterium rutilum]
MQSISEIVAVAAQRPAGLLLEGEAGIGKTTLWLAALQQARDNGFTVLSARAWEAESKLAYGTVADLLADIDPDALATLPNVQRVAVNRVLLRDDAGGPETDQHVVAAAMLSVIEAMATDNPVVLGVDDLQWLDACSRDVLAFVARRLRGRVGVVVTERTEPDRGGTASWLHLARPDALTRVRVSPLSLGGLHELISSRLGRSLPRPTIVRIADVSGGNPFYALEMARAIDTEPELPHTLAELVQRRVADLDDDASDALLAAAAVADPTVELLARATGNDADRMTELLEEVESRGIIEITGNRVHFTHQLLARGVYVGASAPRRRRMHRALADAVVQPELKARHLALASSRSDPEILRSLDDAAEGARARGAPSAAAELLDLAIRLGGDTPSRRIRSASHHFRAGDHDKAHDVLAPALEVVRPGMLRAIALNLLAGICIYRRSFAEAATVLTEALQHCDDNPPVLAQTLLMLSFAQANQGDYDDALANAREAVKHAEVLGIDVLTSQAIADLEVLKALCGFGFDEGSLNRAIALENPDVDVPIPFRAHSTAAQVLAWAGRLDEAREHMEVLHKRCVDRGADGDMLFVSVWSTLIHVWRGDYSAATRVADDAIEHAEQIGGDHPLVIALTVRGLAAAYTGRIEAARADATAAIEAAERFGAPLLAEWPIMTLGFASVSVGDYEQALRDLEPLLAGFDQISCTEIIKAGFVPDAVEAMVALGRSGEAEPMVAALERNGRRLDRSWMLAMAARCRALMFAAAGDVAAAEEAAAQAMVEHDRLAMPFERARTQLVLGQLQRRKRQKQSATDTLTDAQRTFERLGSPLWADRARAELKRTNVAAGRSAELTPSEQRVAELAASGMTNRDIAASLFISAKTVEANMTQIYRKLGIRSRAELGRRMGPRG